MARRPALRFSTAARVAAVLVFAAFAFCAVGSALDRAAREHPALVPYVPAAFAHQVLTVRGQEAMRDARADAMVSLGGQAVDRSPVDAFSTAILGTGRLLKGDAPGARAAFLVSARLGWRTPPTQVYWIREALAMGDDHIASLWLDAMLRQAPGMQDNATVMGVVEGDPAMRSALVDRAMLRPDWLKPYVSDVSALPPEQLINRAITLAALRDRGMVLGCEPVQHAVAALVHAGQMPMASRMWRLHCPLAGAGLIADPDMAGIDATPTPDSPFAWQVQTTGDVTVARQREPSTGHSMLTVSNTAGLTAQVMRQLIVAPAGRYRLDWTARQPSGGSSNAIRMYFGCSADEPVEVANQRDLGQGHWQGEILVYPACGGGWLSMSVAPQTQQVLLGGLALAPLGK